jgi:hypothetical protein
MKKILSIIILGVSLISCGVTPASVPQEESSIQENSDVNGQQSTRTNVCDAEIKSQMQNLDGKGLDSGGGGGGSGGGRC